LPCTVEPILQSPNFQKNNPACTNRLACRVAGFLPSPCYVLNRERIATTAEAPGNNLHKNAQSEPGASFPADSFILPCSRNQAICVRTKRIDRRHGVLRTKMHNNEPKSHFPNEPTMGRKRLQPVQLSRMPEPIGGADALVRARPPGRALPPPRNCSRRPPKRAQERTQSALPERTHSCCQSNETKPFILAVAQRWLALSGSAPHPFTHATLSSPQMPLAASGRRRKRWRRRRQN
jgi:hypothetical protein